MNYSGIFYGILGCFNILVVTGSKFEVTDKCSHISKFKRRKALVN